ncbi:hypothetical protein ABZ914_10730 [Spirillospora sp. NPDC046719]
MSIATGETLSIRSTFYAGGGRTVDVYSRTSACFLIGWALPMANPDWSPEWAAQAARTRGDDQSALATEAFFASAPETLVLIRRAMRMDHPVQYTP